MNTNSISGELHGQGPVRYTMSTDKKQALDEVHPLFTEEAVVIDSDKDMHLSDKELRQYLQDRNILRDSSLFAVDEKKILNDYKLTLQNKPLPQIKAYHSYDQMVSEMKDLQERFPDSCKMVSLAKTHEGRDIWALKVSRNPGDDSSKKPGVIITGTTHAREHIGLEVPIFAAKAMLENSAADPAMQNRIDKAETWFVPMVNPDGYEHSRTVNAWWRKNRRPVTQDACDISNGKFNIAGEKAEPTVKGIGVDLNRNYYSGNIKDMHLYRPEGDTPCSTYDDDGASDSPRSDTYRGPFGASEVETKTLIDFETNNKNIKAAIDFHSYGRMILYPPGAYYGHVDNEEQYKTLGNEMAQIISDSDDQHVKYKVMGSSGLYPATGSSEDFQHAVGILGFTFELSTSFAPSENQIEPECRRLLGAQMRLVDYVIDNADSLRPEA